MKKLIILISVIIIFFVFFLIYYLSPRGYERVYDINEIHVIEMFNKEKEYYYFKFSYEKENFEYAVKTKYTTKRKLIYDIEVEKTKEEICLVPKSKIIETYPVCYSYKNKEYIDYNISEIDFEDYKTEIKEVKDSYKGINVNYYNDNTYLVWNYKGFSYINKEEQKEINFLNKDIYNIDLIAAVNEYLVVPDYDSKHTFNKMYIINQKDGSIKTWNLDYNIYFDSYIVGTNKKSIYLFDYKNEIEYELRPDKQKIRKVKYKAVVNDEWKQIGLGDFNKKITFTTSNVYNYEVINNKLYLAYLNGNNKILISEKDIKDIIFVDENTVYYLVDEKLYMYNINYGEVLLMEYFEWNFNYQNMIYIY